MADLFIRGVSLPPPPRTEAEVVAWARLLTASIAEALRRQSDLFGGITDGEFVKRAGSRLIGGVPPGGGGGDSITVNGAAVTDADFDDAIPAAPAGGENVVWQKDASSPANISAFAREATATLRGILQLAGQIGGTATSPDVRGVRETGGPTLLTIGAVADGEFLKRVGGTVTGAAGAAGISSTEFFLDFGTRELTFT